jgi:hypothetical protein
LNTPKGGRFVRPNRPIEHTREGLQTARSSTLRERNASDVAEAQCEQRRPLLPSQKPRTRRPANDHRAVINGIHWVL